jgi:hypothetical protein
MLMFPCLGCRRHVRSTEGECPFCGAPLRASVAPLGGTFATALVGLALAGCGEDKESGTTVGDTMASTDDASGGQESTEGESTAQVSDTDISGGNDYGGPETSDSFGDSTTGGDESTGGEGSDSSSGTDTGDSTADTGTAEGNDYGAVPPPE